MHAERTKRGTENADEMRVQFSRSVRASFADLAASVHFSNDFDPDILKVVESWANAKEIKVREAFVAFPAIAGEVFRHVHATGDEKAKDAWDAIRNQMPENGFTLSMASLRAK